MVVSGLSAILPLTDHDVLSVFWFDPDSIIHGGPDALLATEIPFRCLDRDVAKQELYLFQFASRRVAQPRAGPSKVVGRQLLDGGFRGALTNDVPNDLLGYALTPEPPGSVHAAKQPTGGNSRVLQPNVKDRFDPVRHRYCPHVTCLSHEIDNRPMLFSLLQVREVQLHGFMPPQTAGKQHREKGMVPFALQPLGIGTLPEGFALFGRQPVSQSHSEFSDAFHSPDTGCQIRAKKTAIGGLVCQPPHGPEA
jgi:hypothetical protein